MKIEECVREDYRRESRGAAIYLPLGFLFAPSLLFRPAASVPFHFRCVFFGPRQRREDAFPDTPVSGELFGYPHRVAVERFREVIS